jgi:hypothetical protein
VSTIRRRLPSGIAVALLLTSQAVGAAEPAPQTLEPGVLSVCLYPGFAPFSNRDGDGRFVGWDVDYLETFALSEGLLMRAVEMPDYIGIWEKPALGVCDIAASGISDTPERRAASGGVVWSRHYYNVLRAFLVRSGDAHALESIDDLGGRTVIVTADSTADHDVRNRLAREGITTTTVQLTTDEEDAARQVRNAGESGEPFAYGGGLGSVRYLAEKLGGLAVAWPHCNMLDDGEQVNEPFSFVVRADDVGLSAALDRFIENPSETYEGSPASDPACPFP